MKEGRSNVKVIKMRQKLVCVDRNDDRFGQAGQLSIGQISGMNSQSSSNTQEMGQKGKLAGGKRTKGQTCWQFYYVAELHVVQTVNRLGDTLKIGLATSTIEVQKETGG